MSFHTILTLTHPTDTDAKKARIAEEIVTAAKVLHLAQVGSNVDSIAHLGFL